MRRVPARGRSSQPARAGWRTGVAGMAATFRSTVETAQRSSAARGRTRLQRGKDTRVGSAARLERMSNGGNDALLGGALQVVLDVAEHAADLPDRPFEVVAGNVERRRD